MKIYIPNHLRKINVVDQMCRMIEEYGNYYTEYVDPYYYYYYSLDFDPVKRFLGICLSGSITNKDQLDNVVNYLTAVFYSIKGCSNKIFEYLSSFVGLSIIRAEYISTGGSIINQQLDTIIIDLRNIPNPEKNSEDFFKNLFEEFFKSLLIVNVFNLNIESLDLTVSGKVEYYVKTDLEVYNKITYEVTESDFKI